LLTVLAFVSGLVVAPLLALFNRRSSRSRETLPRRDDAPLVDAINIAHIRVTGIAGLRFVLLALAVAVCIPSIGVSLAAGAALVCVRSRPDRAKRRMGLPRKANEDVAELTTRL
jgi:hypothetical protein